MKAASRTMLVLAVELVACASWVAAQQPAKNEAQKPTTPKLTQPPSAPAKTTPEKPAPPANTAIVELLVPVNAVVYFGEQKMTQTGEVRRYESPPLEPGKVYVYKVKVTWPTAPGQKDFVIEHEFEVRANQTTKIDFRPLARPAQEVRPSRPSIFPRRPEGSGFFR